MIVIIVCVIFLILIILVVVILKSECFNNELYELHELHDCDDTEFVNASNYSFEMCHHAINLGDSASKAFVEKLIGAQFATKQIVGSAITIGSILTYANKDTIVWGSGFLISTEKMKSFKKIYSVRGPKSYRKLLDQGFDCPKIFGDPFFIVSLLYKPRHKLHKYDIGIIPHYLEKNSQELANYLKRIKNYKIIDIQTNDIQKFVDEISECKVIQSSSLHGVIFAMAYRIPCIWIVLKPGDGFKYHDFLESLNIFNYEPGNIIKYEMSYMLDLGLQIITSCPFMHCALKNKYISKWNEYCLEPLTLLESKF